MEKGSKFQISWFDIGEEPEGFRVGGNKKICSCGGSKSVKALACRKCRPALENYLKKRRHNLSPSEHIQLIEVLKKRGFGPVGVCCFCGERYVLGGNNPSPVIKDKDSRCCVRCCDEIVFPARLQE